MGDAASFPPSLVPREDMAGKLANLRCTRSLAFQAVKGIEHSQLAESYLHISFMQILLKIISVVCK